MNIDEFRCSCCKKYMRVPLYILCLANLLNLVIYNFRENISYRNPKLKLCSQECLIKEVSKWCNKVNENKQVQETGNTAIIS